MLRAAVSIAAKDLKLVLARGTGLIQALLLGLLLIFVFSLSQQIGEKMSAQAAAAIFWLASVFCQVLVFNTLFSLEEQNGARFGLLLSPAPVQAVWIGKALGGFILLLCAQAVFLPATIVFLGQSVSHLWHIGLAMLLAIDLGLILLGALLGALSQGQAAKESLLSIILFPLLIPILLAGVRIGSATFSGIIPEGFGDWLGIACAFDALFGAAGLLLFGFVYSGEE